MAIKTVAVIGAGTMGAGIAQVCAQSGWQTNLFDAFPEGLEKGMKAIDAFWDKGIARGKTTQQQKQQWSQNLSQFTDMEAAVKQADLVIEAVPEIPKLKFQIFYVLGYPIFINFAIINYCIPKFIFRLNILFKG